MTSDEGSESESDPEKSELEELFSQGEESVESEKSGETEITDSVDEAGMDTTIPAERDDAEILTDTSNGDTKRSVVENATPDRTPSFDVDADTVPKKRDSSIVDEPEPSQSRRSATDSNLPEIQTGDTDVRASKSTPSDESDGRPSDQSSNEPARSPRSNRLTTGNAMLDEKIHGGIPPGRMLTLVASPETQSELLVKEMASSRPTVYISTFRPEWEIQEELRDHLQKSGEGQVLDNELEVAYVDPEKLLSDPMQFMQDLPKGSNFIIDSINEFELKDRKRYVKFLNIVKEVLWDTGSVGLFYVIGGATDSPTRALTLKRSDIVWELDQSVTAREIETNLVISKFRGGKALTEPIKLELTDEVTVVRNRDDE